MLWVGPRVLILCSPLRLHFHPSSITNRCTCNLCFVIKKTSTFGGRIAKMYFRHKRFTYNNNNFFELIRSLLHSRMETSFNSPFSTPTSTNQREKYIGHSFQLTATVSIPSPPQSHDWSGSNTYPTPVRRRSREVNLLSYSLN